ncbi:MAG: hypothetical protein ACKN84_03490 [Candidatus Fonsibacter sp.]
MNRLPTPDSIVPILILIGGALIFFGILMLLKDRIKEKNKSRKKRIKK